MLIGHPIRFVMMILVTFAYVDMAMPPQHELLEQKEHQDAEQ